MLLGTLNAQKIEDKEIFVESWKKGNEQITVQTLQVELSKENFEFEKEIQSKSGKRYLISIVKSPIVDVKGEHWKVMLNEITQDYKNIKDVCGDLLLKTLPCETGGDYFPREDYVAYFYPYEEKVVVINGQIPLIEWKPFYTTKTTRKIAVDGFFVIIKSGKIEFDEKDKSKVKSFELIIELKNTCS